ncbi:MAG: RNA helicase, partial [Lysobacteraceae bacterium]
AKLLRAITRMLKRDVEIRDVPGFEPMRPIRWGNDNPPNERPGGNNAPRRANTARRPHSDAPRHAHAGPKQRTAGTPGGGQRDGARSPNPYRQGARPAR